MLKALSLFLFAILSLLLTNSIAAASAEASDLVPANDIIEWVRAKGGFFNEKLEIRRMDPSNPKTPFGVFAKGEISHEERLIEIPRQCYIALTPAEKEEPSYDESDENYSEEEQMGLYWRNVCQLAQKLMVELKLKDKSDFAPYIRYLETQNYGQLPAAWSEAGKNLLRKVMGPTTNASKGNHALPPDHGIDWIDMHFKKTECIQPNDLFQEHAVEMTIQRGYDTALIPIWDMVNHDNGKLNVDSNSLHSEEGLKVWAAREIHSGEELYASYNFCTDCKDIGYDWGTPGILRDFGFVERYPQIWNFEDSDVGQDIWFQLEEDSEKAGELKVSFWDDDEAEIPTDTDQVSFLREQLDRLEAMAADADLLKPEAVPEHEWNTILQFYHAATTAIRSVLKVVTDKVSRDDEL